MSGFSSMADSFLGFAAAIALRALALGLLCFIGLWLLRVRSSAVHYAAWKFVVFAMLMLPFLFPLPSIVSLPKPSSAHFILRNIETSGAELPDRELPKTELAPRPGVVGSHLPRHRTISWRLIYLFAYLLISSIFLLRVLLGWMLMRGAARRMARVNDSHLLQRANRQCEALGLLIFPEFRDGKTATVPVTFGWRNPVIILPADWREWPTDKLDLVLAHELSHIQRGDYLIRMASALNKSLYWFHPLSWWLDRRLAELAEELSDDAALGAVATNRQRYVDILEDFAGSLHRSSGRFQLGIAMSAFAAGSRRIRRILDWQRPLSLKLNLRQKLTVFGIAIPALVLIAGAQTADRSQPLPLPGASRQYAQIPNRLPPDRRRVPSPMFSRAYVNALQGILELESSDVTALQHQLEENPEDFAARLKLIAYCMRADRADLHESRSQRFGLVLWLVEHHPDSEILGSPYGVLSPDDLTADELTQVKREWKAAIGPGQSDARIFWNAANFYQQLDRSLYIASLKNAVLLAPTNEHYALPLGSLYAGAILTVNPQSMYRDPSGADPEFARRAMGALETTTNPYILESAVKVFKSEYNRSLMMSKESTSIGALAQRYFQRAKALDPDLDQAWIYPEIDPKMIGMFASGARPPEDGNLDFENAAKQIRRLPPDAFPFLPPEIQTELQTRGCLIPQQTFDDQSSGHEPQNVIQGEFFEKGQRAWAVLCSVNGTSSILVFRDASDRNPEALARSEDKTELQGAGNGQIAYSRQIAPADRKFIMDHYRGYGGPEPPPIDHQGIDDAFVGKASLVNYWYHGAWVKLQGAD